MKIDSKRNRNNTAVQKAVLKCSMTIYVPNEYELLCRRDLFVSLIVVVVVVFSSLQQLWGESFVFVDIVVFVVVIVVVVVGFVVIVIVDGHAP